MMKKSESGEKKEEKKSTKENETKIMNEKDKIKGMKKVKENAGREVRKKEVKKNEGEAAKEKMKGDSEALNQSEMESILNNRFSDFKEEIKALFENQMKSKLDQLICEFQEVKTAMTFLNEKYEEVLQENKLLKQQN